MKTKHAAAIAFLAMVLTVSLGLSQLPEPDGVLCLTPVEERSCVAVKMPMLDTEALAGIRWYNNDGTRPFPKVLVAGGLNEVPPKYDDAVLVAEDVSGVSSGWSEVTFSEPIASSSEALYVVFQLAPYIERTNDGENGGPGFGYRFEKEGLCVFLSADGDDWVRLNNGCSMLAEPICIARDDSMTTLKNSEDGPVPQVFETELLHPAPNPFNPKTNIRFTLKRDCHVSLKTFNVRGQLVRKLCDETVEAGAHVVEWNGRDDRNQGVASGPYLVLMKADGKQMTQRVMLVR